MIASRRLTAMCRPISGSRAERRARVAGGGMDRVLSCRAVDMASGPRCVPWGRFAVHGLERGGNPVAGACGERRRCRQAQQSGCPCAECSRNHGCDGRRGSHAGSVRRRARIGAPRMPWGTPETSCKRASEPSETRGVPVKMLVCMRKMLLTLGEGKCVRNASEVRQKQHESVRRTFRHCAPTARRACSCCARA